MRARGGADRFVVPNFHHVIAWILLLGPNAGLINVFLRDVFASPAPSTSTARAD